MPASSDCFQISAINAYRTVGFLPPEKFGCSCRSVRCRPDRPACSGKSMPCGLANTSSGACVACTSEPRPRRVICSPRAAP
jgi:hypothetical protein